MLDQNALGGGGGEGTHTFSESRQAQILSVGRTLKFVSFLYLGFNRVFKCFLYPSMFL